MATERMEIRKCNVCGIVAEVLEGGAGELVCCGEPMLLMQARTADTSTEKHVPYIERTPAGIVVRVGQNAAHPMEPKHFIQWIELIADGIVYRRWLAPGQAPQATFPVTAVSVEARELCNIHGLWKG
ncbi:MAG: desulfoferrodoxin [Planctomycetaceae bacterium]|nr:desulfoferrodoxin [Planctomycetaceae bacterium]